MAIQLQNIHDEIDRLTAVDNGKNPHEHFKPAVERFGVFCLFALLHDCRDSLFNNQRVTTTAVFVEFSSYLVGASVPPNETVASIVIGSVALLYARHVDCPGPADGDLATEALAILIGAPFGEVGRRLEIGLDRANQRLATRADEAARAREPGALSRLPWIGLMRNFGLNAVLITLGVAVGMGLIWLARPRLGPSLETTLAVIRLYVVPALGIAVALSTVRRRRGLAFAAASFALGLIGIQMVELG